MLKSMHLAGFGLQQIDGIITPACVEQEASGGQAIGSTTWTAPGTNDEWARYTAQDGRWIAELDVGSVSTGTCLGVANAGSSRWFDVAAGIVSTTSRAGAALWQFGSNTVYGGPSGTVAGFIDYTAPAVGNVIGIVANPDSGKVSMYVNGVLRLTHTLAAGVISQGLSPVLGRLAAGGANYTFRYHRSPYVSNYVYPT